MTQSRGGGGLVPMRGDVWLATLDPTIGREIKKARPCLIVSPPEMNERLHTILAAPMTTGSRRAPSRIPAVFRGRAGLILLDQLRALDKARLIRRLGAVDPDTLAATLATLREIFEE